MEHNIFINEVVHIEKEDQLYRVLWVSQSRNMDTGYHWRSRAGFQKDLFVPKCLKVYLQGRLLLWKDPVVISKGNVTETAKRKKG